MVLRHRAAASNCYIPSPGLHNASPGPGAGPSPGPGASPGPHNASPGPGAGPSPGNAGPGPTSNIKGVGISSLAHSHIATGKGINS